MRMHNFWQYIHELERMQSFDAFHSSNYEKWSVNSKKMLKLVIFRLKTMLKYSRRKEFLIFIYLQERLCFSAKKTTNFLSTVKTLSRKPMQGLCRAVQRIPGPLYNCSWPIGPIYGCAQSFRGLWIFQGFWIFQRPLNLSGAFESFRSPWIFQGPFNLTEEFERCSWIWEGL